MRKKERKMKNKKIIKMIREENKGKLLSPQLILSIVAVLVLFIISLTYAQTSQDESSQLEQELTNDLVYKVYLTNMSECYDNETEILTDKGWKLFDNLSGEEKVMTLNQATGKKEWQLPYERQEFEHDGELYKVILEDGSEMRVSPEHKVYASSMYNKEEMTTNYSVVERADDISFVEMPNPNLNIRDSYVQNLSDFERQRATKSSSLECLPNNSFALTIYESNSSEGMNVILSKISIENVSNSSEESFDFDNISGLCSKNSSLSFNGANICKLISNKSLRISPLEISVLNKTFESITTSIYIKPFFLKSLCIDNLTLSDNSSASFSVNLLFDIISRAIDNFNLSTISFTTLANASSNSFLNLSGISNLTIISSMKSNNDKDYKKLAIKTNFSLQPIKEIYEQINNGEYIYFLNSENKPIKVKSIEKVSYSGKIYDVDISCEIYKKKLRLDALKRSGT